MISSLVVTTKPSSMEICLREIREIPGVELIGDPVVNRLPVTIEADCPKSLMAITDQVRELESVVFVDVVYVSIEDGFDQESVSFN